MPYNYYNNYAYPYYQRPQEPYQPLQRITNLQGKTVDNMEVVKAIDIPLDGSTSYFPLADGTAILSKQLQQGGTSRIIIYRPEGQKQVKYVTETDLDDIKEDIKALKKKIEGETHDTNAAN